MSGQPDELETLGKRVEELEADGGTALAQALKEYAAQLRLANRTLEAVNLEARAKVIMDKQRERAAQAMGGGPATGEPDEKKCPYCAETIKVAAIKCRFCGADLEESSAEELESLRGKEVCLACHCLTQGYIPTGGGGMGGCFALFLTIIFLGIGCFFWPALIAVPFIWLIVFMAPKQQGKLVCSFCKQGGVIPADTPEGIRILRQTKRL